MKIKTMMLVDQCELVRTDELYVIYDWELVTPKF